MNVKNVEKENGSSQDHRRNRQVWNLRTALSKRVPQVRKKNIAIPGFRKGQGAPEDRRSHAYGTA